MDTYNLINKLICGNKRFINNKSNLNNHIANAIELSKKQKPSIGLICCADSRVVPEIIFDQPLGTFLCARIAGNIITPEILATMELGINEFKTSLIIVLAHSNCAAITAACSNSSQLNYLQSILKKIKPAIILTKKSSKKLDLINKISCKNAKLSVENLKEQSTLIKNCYLKTTTKIVAGFYNIENGLVDFFDS